MEFYDVVCLKCGELGKSPSFDAAEHRARRHERKLGEAHYVECWPRLRTRRPAAEGTGARPRNGKGHACTRRIALPAARCTSALTGPHGLGRITAS